MPTGTVIEKLKYYTARVSDATDPGQPRRQHIYLNALRTYPRLKSSSASSSPRQYGGLCSTCLSETAPFSTGAAPARYRPAIMRLIPTRPSPTTDRNHWP